MFEVFLLRPLDKRDLLSFTSTIYQNEGSRGGTSTNFCCFKALTTETSSKDEELRGVTTTETSSKDEELRDGNTNSKNNEQVYNEIINQL